MSIGVRIKSARINAGLSQEALGNKLGNYQDGDLEIRERDRHPEFGSSHCSCKSARSQDCSTSSGLQQIRLSKPVYRARKALSPKDETKILGKTADWLERYLAVEEITGRKSRSICRIPDPAMCPRWTRSKK